MKHHPACGWWRLGYSDTMKCPMCKVIERIDVLMEEQT
jgi:phage FluMu protein Com